MTTIRRVVVAAATVLTTLAVPARAQSWLLRFSGSAQRVEFRGLDVDSIPASAVVTDSAGSPFTSDGFAVSCSGNNFCYFYRAGAIKSGVPASAGVDMSMWGLGLQGLSVRLSARAYTDLTGNRLWPGTSPPLELFEGYAQYVRSGLTAKLGRMLEQGRLASAGTSGLDGLRADWRWHANEFDAGGYAGWGLARGAVLPVTSPAVDPLADYQPSTRQIVVGAFAGVHLARFDVETEYRRELDPVTDYIVAERAAVSVEARATSRIRVVTGADYDIAQALLGSAEGSVSYSDANVSVTAGVKHYRPFFDLWTVWGVFSPVPYNGVTAALTVSTIKSLQLRANGEWFRYDNADVSAPNVTLTDRGWRWGTGATYAATVQWSVDASLHGELVPGASSSGADLRVSWKPRTQWELAAEGGSLERPLELRFQDAGVKYAGGSADFHPAQRWSLGVSIDRYWESRDRPDAAAFDWDQWRMSARVAVTLRSSADRWLPPAHPAGAQP